MNYIFSLSSRLFPLVLLLGVTFGSLSAAAQDRTALDNDVHAAIALLLETSLAAKRLAPSAKGALVFPNIVKAGFLVGVQYGDGALVRAKQGGAITSLVITTSPQAPTVCKRACRHSDT